MARVLGLDIGTVRIGISVSDETGLIARGLATLQRHSWKKDLEAISNLVEEYQVCKVVAGFPLNMDGSHGTMVELVNDFVERLKEVIAVPVELFDERLSSSAAERVLIDGGMQRSRRKKVIDQLAAVVILQNFLDRENALFPGNPAGLGGWTEQ
jgi:putative holliday junction resolvase